MVRVKTYAWLATLEARLDAKLVEEGWMMNEGWAGEWVLQGEGTREGRAALQDMLRGERGTRRQEREFEIVLDKSGSGRLWLRYVVVRFLTYFAVLSFSVCLSLFASLVLFSLFATPFFLLFGRRR